MIEHVIQAWELYLLFSLALACLGICIFCVVAEVRLRKSMERSFFSMKKTLDKSIDLAFEQNKQLERMIDLCNSTRGKQ